MEKDFLASLIGPFPMSETPLRPGFYCINIANTSVFEMTYWSGNSWLEDDDGLGCEKDMSSASGWYGQPNGLTASPVDDGLGL